MNGSPIQANIAYPKPALAEAPAGTTKSFSQQPWLPLRVAL
jgi:hypothetical protein